jgi:hypothetical protein
MMKLQILTAGFFLAIACQALITVRSPASLAGFQLPAIPTLPCSTNGVPGGSFVQLSLKNVSLVLSTANVSASDSQRGNWQVAQPQVPTAVALQVVLYPEQTSRVARDKGFSVMLAFVNTTGLNLAGDFSYIGYIAYLMNWKYECPIPTVYVPWDLNGTDFELYQMIETVDIEYDVNPEASFKVSAGYIIGITIPFLLSNFALSYFSILKLWRTGFPYVRHGGSYLCLIGLTMSILNCKTILLLQFSEGLL